MGEGLTGRVADARKRPAAKEEPVVSESKAEAEVTGEPELEVEAREAATAQKAADRLYELARSSPVPAADPPPVHVALARVMSEVRSLGKDQLHKSATAGTWKFRGIDDVMNAVGPAIRNHGVLILPELLEVTYRDTNTKGGSATREVTVKVAYTFVGPRGDTLRVVVPGESLDAGDKGTAKAMSVALRIALLQSLCLPTDEPDPDSQAYERAPDTNPADEPRDQLLELCQEKHYDSKQVAAAFFAKYQEPIGLTANAGRVWAFLAQLGADPVSILGAEFVPVREDDPDPEGAG